MVCGGCVVIVGGYFGFVCGFDRGARTFSLRYWWFAGVFDLVTLRFAGLAVVGMRTTVLLFLGYYGLVPFC